MRRTHNILALASLSTLGLIAGCNIVGAAGVLVSGPPKVAAVTGLEKDRPTVLLIDDLNSRMPRASLRDRIGQAAERQMLDAKVIREGQLISSSSARRVVSGDTNEARTSIVDTGRAVRAEVVVHVTIETWTLSATPGEVSPEAIVSVKVLDAMKNQRQWPAGEGAYTMKVDLPLRADRAIDSNADRRRIEDSLADRIGVAIAKLFYTSERERISEQRELN